MRLWHDALQWCSFFRGCCSFCSCLTLVYVLSLGVVCFSHNIFLSFFFFKVDTDSIFEHTVSNKINESLNNLSIFSVSFTKFQSKILNLVFYGAKILILIIPSSCSFKDARVIKKLYGLYSHFKSIEDIEYKQEGHTSTSQIMHTKMYSDLG